MTPLEICNYALSLLGQPDIMTIEDPEHGEHDDKNTRLCRRFYGTARRAVLTAHDWGFARKTSLLTQVKNKTPLTPIFRRAFALPPDMLKLLSIWYGVIIGAISQADFQDIDPPNVPNDYQTRQEVDSHDYEIVGDVLFTNAITPVARYTADFSANTELIPIQVAEAIGTYMALLMSPSITGKVQERMRWERIYPETLRRAKFAVSSDSEMKVHSDWYGDANDYYSRRDYFDT